MTDAVKWEASLSLTARIRGFSREVAEDVTEEFLNRHPDWASRYSERARLHGVEDAEYHLAFLAGALETSSIAAFEDYARWTARVMAARGISVNFLQENLLQIAAALAQRLPEPDSSTVRRYLERGAVCAAESAGGGGNEADLPLSTRLFLQAILQGHRTAALGIAREVLRSGAAVLDLYADVIQESLYAVGRLWETNRITVAEEHLATAVTQSVLAQLYPELPRPEAERGTAVISGVEGELHQIGANLVADTLEAAGWTVRFLGTNVPPTTIVQLAQDCQAELVGLSVTMLFNVPQARRLIAGLRTDAGRAVPKVLVGGGAFRANPDLWRQIGADGFSPDVRGVHRLLGLA